MAGLETKENKNSERWVQTNSTWHHMDGVWPLLLSTTNERREPTSHIVRRERERLWKEMASKRVKKGEL